MREVCVFVMESHMGAKTLFHKKIAWMCNAFHGDAQHSYGQYIICHMMPCQGCCHWVIHHCVRLTQILVPKWLEGAQLQKDEIAGWWKDTFKDLLVQMAMKHNGPAESQVQSHS